MNAILKGIMILNPNITLSIISIHLKLKEALFGKKSET